MAFSPATIEPPPSIDVRCLSIGIETVAVTISPLLNAPELFVRARIQGGVVHPRQRDPGARPDDRLLAPVEPGMNPRVTSCFATGTAPLRVDIGELFC